jgi:hypothetical protein
MLQTVFFIGAGASVPFGVPTMKGMVQSFEKSMEDSHYGLKYIVDEIKNKLVDYRWYDIEALITVLQDIIDYENKSKVLYNNPSIHFFSPIAPKTFMESISTIGQRYHNEAIQILGDVKDFIGACCSFREGAPFNLYYDLFSCKKFGLPYPSQVINQSGNPLRISNDIFTTNYDLVIEAFCSQNDIVYETGANSGKIDIEHANSPLFQNSEGHRIIKLHGSINWYLDGKGNKRASDGPVKIGGRTPLGHEIEKEMLVYPAYSKYTYREPFYMMFHHLKGYLSTPTCKNCCVVGYSFRDEDILAIFKDAMDINKNEVQSKSVEIVEGGEYPSY